MDSPQSNSVISQVDSKYTLVYPVDRLELKKQLNCKPFHWYAEKFKGRSWCLVSMAWFYHLHRLEKLRPEGYRCGTVNTVNPSDLNYISYQKMFYKDNSTIF